MAGYLLQLPVLLLLQLLLQASISFMALVVFGAILAVLLFLFFELHNLLL